MVPYMPIQNTTTQSPNTASFKGFKRNGPVARTLKEFDKKLTESVKDILKLENSPLNSANKAERAEDLRKKALPDEREFEKKLAKAYRQEYGQAIPGKYAKQAARSIKNLLERVRFYTYSPNIIPVADYAPPAANKPGGKKFTELDNKSWASISEPGDERYPGWYQSTTKNEDIMTWLNESDADVLPSVIGPSGALVGDEGQISRNRQSQKRGHFLEPDETPSKRRSLSSCKTLDTSASERSTKSPFLQVGTSEPESAGMSSPAYSHDLTDWPLGEHNLFSNIPTPRYTGLLDDDDLGIPILPFATQPDAPWISRAPTPGLNFYDELVQALRAEPRSTNDIVHYFLLAHQGRPEQKARALFRLSRDLDQGKDIDVDRYLHLPYSSSQGSGSSSRAHSPEQVFNRPVDNLDTAEGTPTTPETRGRQATKAKIIEPRKESRQRMVDEFRQLENSGLGDNQLNDIRFPFYNRKRLISGNPPPRSKPKGEIPGIVIRQWLHQPIDSP